MTRFFRPVLSLLALAVCALPAAAAEPKPTRLSLQDAATPSMERLVWFHDGLLMWIIAGIVVLVAVLIGVVTLRFNARVNPEPSKTTHNVLLEVVWTLIPVLILIMIAVPSFKLLYYLDRTENPDMTLKTIGYQWGWTYQYPDYGDIEFNADMIVDDDMDTYIPEGKGRRLLETYNPVVLPINRNIQILTTANDVIHAWAIPAFGLKKDSVPGRLNEMWTRIERTGVYFGQCSEICGINHAFMPIMVYAVTPDEFEAWTECMNGEGASANFPARECAQKFDFDKYRDSENQITLAVADADSTPADANAADEAEAEAEADIGIDIGDEVETDTDTNDNNDTETGAE